MVPTHSLTHACPCMRRAAPRRAAPQMFYKRARVEYVPLGVVAAIVPWNYPFHNIFNPLTAALFAGTACVIKVRCRGGGGLVGVEVRVRGCWAGGRVQGGPWVFWWGVKG